MRWHKVDTSAEHASRAGVSIDAQCLHLMLQRCADDSAFHSAPLAETMRRYGCDQAEAFAKVMLRSGLLSNITKRFRRGMADWVRELCQHGLLAAEDSPREGMRMHSLADGRPIEWEPSPERDVTGTSRGRQGIASARNHSTTTSDGVGSAAHRSGGAARADAGPATARQPPVSLPSRGRQGIASARNDAGREAQIREEGEKKRGGGDRSPLAPPPSRAPARADPPAPLSNSSPRREFGQLFVEALGIAMDDVPPARVTECVRRLAIALQVAGLTDESNIAPFADFISEPLVRARLLGRDRNYALHDFVTVEPERMSSNRDMITRAVSLWKAKLPDLSSEVHPLFGVSTVTSGGAKASS